MKQAVAAGVVLLLASGRPVFGQTADSKAAFLQSLGRFSTALDGQLGDEGPVIRASLEAMARGLEQWDNALRASETAFAGALPGSTATAASQMHVAIGAAFLDRSRLQDALREFDAGTRLAPTRGDVFMFQGVAYDQAAADFDRAAAAFRQASVLEPANPLPAYLLARALAKSGKVDDARQAFQAVLRLWRKDVSEHARAHDAPFIRLGLVQERSGVEPFFPPVQYAEGFVWLQRGEFAKALDAFNRAVGSDSLAQHEVDPRDALAIAASAYRNGDAALSMQAVKVAVERDPNRADVHRLFGRVLLASRQDEEGVKELQLAVRLSPGDERAHLALADALVQLRRYEDAEHAFQQTLSAFPASGRAHYSLGRLYQRQNKTLEALSEYEAAAKLTPLIGANRLLQTIGALNAARQDFDAALQAYSARVDIHPNDAEAHRILGYTYARLERRDEAFGEFAIALWLAPDAPDVFVAMSQLSLKDGDFAAAADAARQAIKLNPSNKQAHYSLGTALMRLEKPGDAAPEFEVFERLQAEDTAAAARQMRINAFRREAAASLETREYDRAIAALRKALDLVPGGMSSDLELIHEQLAAAYAGLGQRDESRNELAIADQLRRAAQRREADR